MSEPVYALITGGGTGGHTYPAVAVAQELVQRGHPRPSIRFVGGRRGIEGRVVPEAGFEIDLLSGRGLQRRLTLANLAAIFGAVSAFFRAVLLVRRYRPRIVVGFGGYASLPCVAAARLWRVPTLIHEQDAAPGLANRIGVRLGAKAAVSLPNTPLPDATLTGNPLREVISAIERKPEWEPALLAVFGGAQGARTINRATIGCYDRWRNRGDFTVHHVCGPKNFDESKAALDAQRRAGDVLSYELVAYEPHMEDLLARATLAVCRSGAGTVAELTVAGVPAVLVPLPGSPSDHQMRNAQTLEQAGAVLVVRDDECDPPRLDGIVSELMVMPERLEQMSKAAKKLARPTRRRASPISWSSTPRAALVPDDLLDLSQPRRLHIVGVGGVGMSAIALLLARMGHEVSGSDLKDSISMARLAAAGVKVSVGNRAENVPPDADAVVYSTAIPARNVELVAARELGIVVLHRSAALAALARTRRTIAVAGSHGKTTTSSMLALMLRSAGWQPSFVIGGEVNEVGANAAYGDGEWLVVEADESDGTFLRLGPEAAIVTSVEADHLDYYGGFPELIAAFERFVDAVPGPVVCCADDLLAARIAAAHPGVRTYGFDPSAHYRIVDVTLSGEVDRFTLMAGDERLGELVVPLAVKAATNATGAAALALELGVPFAAIAEALRGFGGVARRFERRGERDGVTFIDDYAHLPGEVAAAIATARQGGWQRVIAVFQPHRYTRTASLWRDFAGAFDGADAVVLTDVYPAGETPIAGVSGRLVVHAVVDASPRLPVSYLPRPADLVDLPRRLARPGDLVLTLGAGNLTALPDAWLAENALAENALAGNALAGNAPAEGPLAEKESS